MTNALETGVQQPRSANPKRAVPVLLFLFVFSLVIDNAFKNASKPIADDLGLSVATVSMQATIAGVLIGIGAVVYATLADSVDIRRLLVAAIIMMCAGSVLGYFFQHTWPMILAGRIVQTAGLAAAETLYVIYVTKHLEASDQKTYLGLSTSCFQLSLLIGTLTSGFVSTYLGWTGLFLLPLLSLLALPAVLRTIPSEEHAGSHLDVLGLVLVGTFALGTIMFMQAFQWVWLVVALAGAAAFVAHIHRNPKAIITPAFFANRRYTAMLLVVFIVYSVQLGYSFLFPFFLMEVHGFTLSHVSVLLVPGYVCAAIVGALSGVIARWLSSRTAITVALALISLALAVPAIFFGGQVPALVISMMVFSSAFALMYAPLLNTAIGDIPAQKSGIAVGFYNLVINIAIPLGIALTAKLIDTRPHWLDGLMVGAGGTTAQFGNVMLVLAAIAVLALVLYRTAIAAVGERAPDAG